MRLNLGCGHNKRAGWVNVDRAPGAEPDRVWDLEETPWPWQDDAATEVAFIRSLEHMGGTPAVFLAIMCELYRIAAPGCRITIHALHPRHDDFLADPTLVRGVTPGMLKLFDRRLNDQWREGGYSNTPFAHYLGVDFRILERTLLLDEAYDRQLRSGALSQADAIVAVRERNNVGKEYRIVLEAVKV